MPAPALTRRQLLHYALRSLAEATLFFALVKLLGCFTLLILPPGKSYVLDSFSLGLLFDAAERIGLYTAAFIFYTIPFFNLRRAFGCFLRAFLFFLIVVLIAYVDCRQYLAVVETPATFECYRCIPFGHDSFPKNNLPPFSITEKPHVRILTFNHDPRHNCKPVWRNDTETNQTLDALFIALRAAH